MKVIVHIDKLVLRGVEHAHAEQISANIESQLHHLLAAPGVAGDIATLGNHGRIKTQPVQANNREQLATRVAQRMVDSMTKRREQ
jgi:hypothetical protein